MFLLLVTLVSTLLAAIMSVVAWRIAVDERRRSDARVEMLAAEMRWPEKNASIGGLLAGTVAQVWGPPAGFLLGAAVATGFIGLVAWQLVILGKGRLDMAARPAVSA